MAPRSQDRWPVRLAPRPAPNRDIVVPAMKTMTLMLVLLLSLVGACGKSDGDTAEKVFADMTANMQ